MDLFCLLAQNPLTDYLDLIRQLQGPSAQTHEDPLIKY